jgi:hypothetical protein
MSYYWVCEEAHEDFTVAEYKWRLIQASDSKPAAHELLRVGPYNSLRAAHSHTASHERSEAIHKRRMHLYG